MSLRGGLRWVRFGNHKKGEYKKTSSQQNMTRLKRERTFETDLELSWWHWTTISSLAKMEEPKLSSAILKWKWDQMQECKLESELNGLSII